MVRLLHIDGALVLVKIKVVIFIHMTVNAFIRVLNMVELTPRIRLKSKYVWVCSVDGRRFMSLGLPRHRKVCKESHSRYLLLD